MSQHLNAMIVTTGDGTVNDAILCLLRANGTAEIIETQSASDLRQTASGLLNLADKLDVLNATAAKVSK